MASHLGARLTAPSRVRAWRSYWRLHAAARARRTSIRKRREVGRQRGGDAGGREGRGGVLIWVMGCTHSCAMDGCAPCRAKILQSAGLRCAANGRPESCPRFKHFDRAPGRRHCIGLYSGKQNILTVGDGDLSFSLALARALGGGRLVATSYEVRDSRTPSRLQPPYPCLSALLYSKLSTHFRSAQVLFSPS